MWFPARVSPFAPSMSSRHVWGSSVASLKRPVTCPMSTPSHPAKCPNANCTAPRRERWRWPSLTPEPPPAPGEVPASNCSRVRRHPLGPARSTNSHCRGASFGAFPNLPTASSTTRIALFQRRSTSSSSLLAPRCPQSKWRAALTFSCESFVSSMVGAAPIASNAARHNHVSADKASSVPTIPLRAHQV